ncbi:SseB family protein [Microbacterium sp. zg.Y625]|uniref:SseB family protein n=1 Tax=Microbacterium jiangjiandongii TaxID=3049071 RepID=UPI00214CC876|nr:MULTISPECIES: SseB family protein [unclassified Microbacterium]MCR2794416.1 SseB family protein [Microbacterium sp. zg.Y625]WIM26326.1 SseB family protein [Microbacterium sp. zg-Y625]
MSPAPDDHCGNSGDSAGVPWEGRAFQANPHAGDDGSADPALLAALTAFRAGEGDQVAVVDAYRSARLLIPLVAEKGDEGVGPTGLAVDKTQELSIVTVAAPDGRRVLPVFTSVTTMQRWDATARPVPADGVRTALAAANDDTDLIVIDPTSETEFVLRRPAVWAIGQGRPWEPSYASPEVYRGLQESIGGELAVLDLSVAPGDPEARLRGPELVVRLQLIAGLEQSELDAVLQRLAARWAADDRVAVLVDSLTVKLLRAAE